MIANIDPLFAKAMEAFGSARTDDGNDYSRVTPAQLIVTLIEQMGRIIKSAKLPEPLGRTGPAP